MSLSSVRPDVSELQFQLLERSLHPELLIRHQGMNYQFDDYLATIEICDAGHKITVERNGRYVTEVITSVNTPLPQFKRLLQHNLKGSRDQEFQFEFGVKYQNSCQVESVDAEVFMQIHEELLMDSRKLKMVCQFPTQHRFSPAPLSLIHAEATPENLLVHTYHTFPENWSIVKTQSLFEF